MDYFELFQVVDSLQPEDSGILLIAGGCLFSILQFNVAGYAFKLAMARLTYRFPSIFTVDLAFCVSYTLELIKILELYRLIDWIWH